MERILQVFRGLQQRRPSFLAEPVWLESPWAFLARDPHDHLIDILLKAPSIYADADAAENAVSPPRALAALVRGIHQCWQVNEELDAWFGTLESSVSGALYWPELATMKTPADAGRHGMLFPVAFCFPSFLIAHTLVLYWTASVILHQHLCVLYRRVEALAGETEACTCEEHVRGDGLDAETVGLTACLRHFKPHQLPRLGARRDWARTVARDLCQSVEYFLKDSMRCLGPASILPSLMTVGWLWEHEAGDWDREVAWVRHMLVTVQRKGNEIAGCTEAELEEYRGSSAGSSGLAL